ncbi:uracil-DNA glycosylase family protein [Natrialbaceae archaeon A-gly3]
MKNVTDRERNPFGMRPPGAEADDEGRAVFGYGDANADFHLIGDHPGVHGGKSTGVPFTGTPAGEAIQGVLAALEFASGPPDRPTFENLFASYLHLCSVPDGHIPTAREYADLEPYFDAELRAINAHILMPVGEQATDHVLSEYTAQRHRLDLEMADLHARQIRGRGFLVVPIKEPTAWTEGDEDEIVSTLETILESDYRQTKGVATRVG